MKEFVPLCACRRSFLVAKAIYVQLVCFLVASPFRYKRTNFFKQTNTKLKRKRNETPKIFSFLKTAFFSVYQKKQSYLKRIRPLNNSWLGQLNKQLRLLNSFEPQVVALLCVCVFVRLQLESESQRICLNILLICVRFVWIVQETNKPSR